MFRFGNWALGLQIDVGGLAGWLAGVFFVYQCVCVCVCVRMCMCVCVNVYVCESSDFGASRELHSLSEALLSRICVFH